MLTFKVAGQSSTNNVFDSLNYITYPVFFEKLQERDTVQIFYKPEWFVNKKINSSFANLKLEDALSRVKRLTNLSYIVIDQHSYVLVPFQSSFSDLLNNHPDMIIIGHPDEFGKFAKATIKGKILDGKTGEPLPGAMINVQELKIAQTTDAEGNFKITLPVGEHLIRLTYIGYEDNMMKIKLVSNGTTNFELFEKSIKIKEVVVSAERAEFNVSSTQMSMLRMDAKAIRELPVSLGEIDIIKSVALLPGIQTAGDFGTGFNVRGGSADQNLILVEDVPLFNSAHMFGLTSTINADDVSDVTLLKGGIPARYGERASSVMDIRLGTADTTNKPTAKGGIGLLESRLSVNVPMFNHDATLLLGGRFSYSDWLLHEIPNYDLQNSSASFYDLDALYTIHLNAYNKFILFGYYSNDNFSFDQDTHYQYSSTLGSIRWTHLYNKRLFSSLMTGFSQYIYGVNELDTLQLPEANQIYIKMNYNNLKWNFTWLPNDKHSIDFGINSILYRLEPGEEQPYGSGSTVAPFSVQHEKGFENAIYISDNFKIFPRLSTEVGLRFVDFLSLGPGSVTTYMPGLPYSVETALDTLYYKKNQIIHQYYGLEPRIAFRYNLSEVSSVKLSYNRINQFIHLISNNEVMSPTDTWILSGTYIKPLISDQFAIGYFRNFAQNGIETSVEGYYKTLRNDIDYINGAQLFLYNNLETQLINANSINYGVEFYARKSSGLLTGWFSYTYSRSLIRTNGSSPDYQINGNQYYPSDFDKPNNLVINANYHISRRWRFAGIFVYSTGRPVTLPELRYLYMGNELVYYSARNAYRLPDYDRLDLAITFDENLKVKKMWKGSWTLSVINVYGRKNVYSVYYAKEDPRTLLSNGSTSLYMVYIIGIPLPTLTYNFTF